VKTINSFIAVPHSAGREERKNKGMGGRREKIREWEGGEKELGNGSEERKNKGMGGRIVPGSRGFLCEQGIIEVKMRCTHLQLLIISFDETFLVTFFTLPCLGARALLIN
jgi:hypothetical protein